MSINRVMLGPDQTMVGAYTFHINPSEFHPAPEIFDQTEVAVLDDSAVYQKADVDQRLHSMSWSGLRTNHVRMNALVTYLKTFFNTESTRTKWIDLADIDYQNWGITKIYLVSLSEEIKEGGSLQYARVELTFKKRA